MVRAFYSPFAAPDHCAVPPHILSLKYLALLPGHKARSII